MSPPAASVIECSPAAVGGDLVGHHEVARRADGRGQAPVDTDEVDVGAGESASKTSSTNMIPAMASATPASVRLLGRRRVVAHSQPTTSTGAVYSSSSATPTDRCDDGVVVAELRPGDRDDAVGDHGLAQCCSASRTQSRLDDGGEDGHRERAAGQPRGDGGGRAPARLHQRLGQRAGHAERERGGDREEQSEPEVVGVLVVVQRSRSSGTSWHVMSKMNCWS